MGGPLIKNHLFLQMGGGKMNFTYFFYSHAIFRHSCGVCHFANTCRPSDLTLADFWGFEKVDPNLNSDDKGCSLVLVNTKKGSEILKEIQDRIDCRKVDLNMAMQPNLKQPSGIDKHRMDLERDYKKYGFRYVMYRYGNIGPIYWLRKQKQKIKKFFKR